METTGLKIDIHVSFANDWKKLRRHAFDEGEYLIGSGQDADLRLAYPTVSRAHARIRIKNAQVFFQDLSSRNGSYRIPQEMRCGLSADEPWFTEQQIRIGPFTLFWLPAKQASCTKKNESEELSSLAAQYGKLLHENTGGQSDLLSRYLEDSAPSHWSAKQRAEAAERIFLEFHGDGPINSFLENPNCREILINGPREIYVDLGQGLFRSETAFFSTETLEAWARRTAHHSGRRLDLQHPICEATLSDGARFHAVLGPLSARGTSVAIRRFGSAPISENDALATGWLETSSLEILKNAIDLKKNIVISGGTSTGKTSLLNFLCQYLPENERIITIEDTLELSPPVLNLVQLQARSSNADGVGAVSLRELVQCALRMRPDRLIVGECRGAEVLEMLQALNTGHPGSLTTVHANSAAEALQRLELLASLGAPNLSVECLRSWIRSSVNLVVQVDRDQKGLRSVVEIAATGETHSLGVLYRRSNRSL